MTFSFLFFFTYLDEDHLVSGGGTGGTNTLPNWRFQDGIFCCVFLIHFVLGYLFRVHGSARGNSILGIPSSGEIDLAEELGMGDRGQEHPWAVQLPQICTIKLLSLW